MSANKKYKDSIFTTLFQEKDKIIELYNAIEGTNYNLDTEIEINTLESALYLDRRNDISFTIDGKFIVLLEHQSSINNNMPLRFLLYIARVYEKLIDNKAIYKERKIPIPTPEFIVLYNGTKEYPEEQILRLSDSFIESGNELELVVRIINVNYGKSEKILKKSKTLNDYSYFVYLVKQYKKQGDIEYAVKKAITDCIEENVLKDFLKNHGSEVQNMLLAEFNLEDAKEMWQEEAREAGREEGREEGLEEGREEGLEEGKKVGALNVVVSLLDLVDERTLAEKTGLSLDEIRTLKNKR